MRKRCVLDAGHDGDHVYPTRKPIGDRYADGEFRGRTLSIPGVTVPGNVPRCRSYYDFRYSVVVEGQTVSVERSERFILLIRVWSSAEEKLVWELFRVGDELQDLSCWWLQGNMEHFRVLDQQLGHVWQPELRLEKNYDGEAIEVRGR